MGSNSTGDTLEDAQLLLIQFPNPTANDLISLVNRTSTISESDSKQMFKAFTGSQQGAMVHRGFYGEWLAVKPMVLPALKAMTQRYPDYDISFVGHSLGGAMAVVGAADAVVDGLAPATRVRIITFGQPRVGNSAFRDFVNGMKFKEISRIVQSGDIIPHLGLASWGFSHISKEYFVEKGGSMRTCNDSDMATMGRIRTV
ncbi:alpha/beta-hydrolase [Rhizoclosmatium globosum]|uniref:Alpha/beta-hydrolase n=1 Tax=Rhizoclosmatium globosum TaxID=329046 RepID=A0A1Y2CW01_9FUNG|nr:alpha/beta-hydrolase [Rhizoclosmatium globosum]|eukprot:ORY51229.1 alpha/beta-hydrolase [Rhizoclosmatium globosum]